MIYMMRYRHAARGVTSAAIEARDTRTAELVGQAYCANLPGTRYIAVEAFVVATEAILEASAQPSAEPAFLPHPGEKEQAERMAAVKGARPAVVVSPPGTAGRVGA